MDLKQLKYFARIVELESITAAAQSLFVAQPSLSQHVANLEAELGVKLLNRGAHGARATTPGELLYQYAKTILRQVEEATVAVKQQAHDPAGHVTLGLPTSTSRIVAVELLRGLTERHRQVSLEIVEGSSAELADQISRQRLDLTVAVDVQDNARFDIDGVERVAGSRDQVRATASTSKTRSSGGTGTWLTASNTSARGSRRQSHAATSASPRPSVLPWL